MEFGIDDDGCSLAIAVSDYDLDKDLDLQVVNNFGAFIKPNTFYQNNTDTSLNIGADLSIYGIGGRDG